MESSIGCFYWADKIEAQGASSTVINLEWYNTKHKHSGINYVTLAQRYNGLNIAILKKRNITYANAKIKNPLRRCKNHKF